MDYREVIFKYAPTFWDPVDPDETELLSGTGEYNLIESQVHQAIGSDRRVAYIKRIQNVIDFGQFLVREQFLACAQPHHYYYRVRRFVVIEAACLGSALKYNLDPRRCELSSLEFRAQVSLESPWDCVLLVVQVLTQEPHADVIHPNNSLEYFIEYVVKCI